MVLTRNAILSDYEAIYEINKTCLGYNYDLVKTKIKLEKILSLSHYKILVAEIDNKVVGYILASDYEILYLESLKNILSLGVLEKYRNQKIGRLLIDSIEDWAKKDGALGIRLVSSSHRELAHIFYQKCSYTIRKDQKNFIKYF